MNERLDPPDYDEDRLDEITARDQAREEIDQTPERIAAWMYDECSGDSAPLDAYDLARKMATGERDLCVPELLAVVFNAPATEAVAALFELRDKFRSGTEDSVSDRAEDLLRQQERQDEDESEHDPMNDVNYVGHPIHY